MHLHIVLILSFVWSASSQLYTDIVKTSSGPIQGITTYFDNSRVEEYLGIPFAEPPTGQLRFRKPEPVKPWSTVLVADKPGPACVQYTDYPYPWYDMYGYKSENCLFLNIWVPKSARYNSKIPVLFYIYGDGWTVGSNQMPVYNGLALAALGDVIVVTTNYRLAALGFLTTFTETAPGNMALYDVLEALKWVNKNIAAFGGDPDQVTLAGNSAGSITTGIFCVSPLTEGLFSRVIMLTGSPAYLMSENKTANMAKSQKLAEALGCANDAVTIYNNPDRVVDCLRGKSAYDIVITENSFHPHKTIWYFPSFGDELVPINPRLALIAGKFRNVDVLIGNVHDEGAHIAAGSKPELFGVYGLNYPRINKTLGESLMDELFKDFYAKENVKEYYLGDLRKSDYDEIREQVYTSVGDYMLLCPTKYFAETYSRAGNAVYYYFFGHRPSTTPWAEWMKVVHFEDIQFTFGQPLLNPGRYTRREVDLSMNSIRRVANFVKYGSPNDPPQMGTYYTHWPLYSRNYPYYLSTKGTPNGVGPHQQNCDFFRPYFGFV